MKTLKVFAWACVPIALLYLGLAVGISGFYNLYVAYAFLVCLFSFLSYLPVREMLPIESRIKLRAEIGERPWSRWTATALNVCFLLVLIWYGKAIIATVAIITIFNFQVLYKKIDDLATVEPEPDQFKQLLDDLRATVDHTPD